MAIKSGKLSPVEKSEIQDYWELGELTLDEIADRLGRHRDSVRKFIARKGIVKGIRSATSPAAIEAAIAKAATEEAALTAVRIRETRDENWKIATFIQKLIGAELNKNHISKANQSVSFENFRSLLQASQALRTAQQVRERALGMDKDKVDDEKPLPTLEVSVVSDTEIAEMQKANKVGSSDKISQAIAEIDRSLASKKK